MEWRYLRVRVEAAFERRKVPSLYGFVQVKFADKPADAPIVHFGGPLTLEPRWTIGGRAGFMCAEICTPGEAGEAVVITVSQCLGRLTQATPALELEYRDEKNAVIREKAKFYRSSIEEVYLYPVAPGEKGDNRQVKITLTFYRFVGYLRVPSLNYAADHYTQKVAQ